MISKFCVILISAGDMILEILDGLVRKQNDIHMKKPVKLSLRTRTFQGYLRNDHSNCNTLLWAFVRY